MSVLPRSVEKVIEEFERLPGVGPKSAARMAYFFLRAPKERAERLSTALIDLKEKVVTCSECFNVADRDVCDICADPARDNGILCVVEEPLDVVALEYSGVYTGRYFVVGGVISPADGIGPEHLRMTDLKRKVQEHLKKRNGGGDVLEVVIATNPSLEGEATASYIVKMLREMPSSGERLVVSRLAMGLPTGADLEYADRLTLKRAIEGRSRL